MFQIFSLGAKYSKSPTMVASRDIFSTPQDINPPSWNSLNVRPCILYAASEILEAKCYKLEKPQQ